MKKRVYNFNLPDDLRDYLKKESGNKDTTISNYIINLIEKDKKEKINEVESSIKESNSIEGDIIKCIVNNILMKNIFKPFDSLIEIEKEISNEISRQTKIESELNFRILDKYIVGNVLFNDKQGVKRSVDITIFSNILK